jgi:hypothetical protein
MKRNFFLRLSFFSILFSLSFSSLRADEGMWLPVLLDQLSITDMRADGFKLTAEDIYSVNHSSMKDGVVQFGGGCTAELISPKGLLLTNHHCGYSFIQYHSTVEHNYLDNGFWAMNQEEELPCPGLTVTFIVSMKEVTTEILAGVQDTMSEISRSAVVSKNAKAMEKENTKDGLEAMVRAFYYGNVYYMFITQTYTDVRMVGAPPQQIGNFGGDSDNWMWPRQTGDFSLFRIYADKNNNPAKYSKDNIPYTPKHFFKINKNGVGENDFTMVYGFPGRTTEYLSSYGVNLIENVSDPIKVDLRTKRISIMEDAMHKNEKLKIKYAAKRNGTANAWKKWQGEMKGLKENDAIAKKDSHEKEFMKRVNGNRVANQKYGMLLANLKTQYDSLIPWQSAQDYYNEGCFSVELVRFAYSFSVLVKLENSPNPDPKEREKDLNDLKSSAATYFKDYDAATDEEIAISMFGSMKQGLNINLLPAIFSQMIQVKNGGFKKYFDKIYSKTIFVNEKKTMKLLNNYVPADWKKIANDAGFKMASSCYDKYTATILPQCVKRQNEINRLSRIYMAAQMEMFSEQRFYPDANSTLRVAYGKVDAYSNQQGVEYNWFSTLDGVMEKEDSTSFDYKVPKRLHQLWELKDYGTYADKSDGKIHTTFIATNHTTGGNSGSPVLDANGNLIGTNFDRCWEGTMSDVNYDPSVCRNIVLDVRYTLFIIDKYAGAGYLLDEMQFAN